MILLVLRRGSLTMWQQLYYRRGPLGDDEGLLLPNLYNVAEGHRQRCWLCLANLDDIGGLPWPEKIRAVVDHVFSTAWNRSAEVHEGNSYFGAMRTLDPRIATPEAWEEATRQEPRFVLGVAWPSAGTSVSAELGGMLDRVVLVGLGGVGGIVLRHLVPFLHSRGAPATVVAIDGDVFEERNRARMAFGRPGPKAVVLAEELGAIYGDRVTVLPVPRFLTPRNAGAFIGERDVVFSQPDNHATRRLVERRCVRLRNVALFTGGNDGIEEGRTGTYGTVHAYLRAAGRDLTNPPSRFHPEIARPADRPPGARGCAAAAAAGAPQLLFTNAAVAAAMLGAYHAWGAGALAYEELHFDLLLGRMAPIGRPPPGARRPPCPGPRSAGR